MRILFVMGHKPVIGGHFKTAQAWMRGMTQLGHEVHVITPDAEERLLRPFRELKVQFHTLGEINCVFNGRFKLWNEVQCGGELGRYLKKYRIEFVFIQDLIAMIPGAIAAFLGRVPCCYVQAGGQPRNDNPPDGAGVVVCSGEQRDGYRKWGLETECIRARIDTTVYFPDDEKCELLDNYKVEAAGMTGFMAIRLDKDKQGILDSLCRMVEDSLLPPGSQILLAGAGPLEAELRERAAEFNSRGPDAVALHLVGPIYDADQMRKIYSNVDFVCGNGRGLMEAMSCGAAAVVFGNHGEVEVVTEETVDAIAYYNFSGRHFEHRESPVKNECIQIDIELLKLKGLHEFSFRYAQDNLNFLKGVIVLGDFVQKLQPIRWHKFVPWFLGVIYRRLSSKISVA